MRIIIRKRYGFHLLTLYCLLAFTILFTSCNPVNENPPVYPVKSKTVLFYMAANNNLSEDIINNIQQMESGFVPDKESGNLIIYSHTLNAKPKLIRMYKDESGKIVRDTVYNFPDWNSATPQALTSAIKVVTTMYPAQENGLILSSHGTGWLPTGYYSSGTFPDGVLGVQGAARYPSAINSVWPEYHGGIDPYANMVKSFGAENGIEMEITALVKALPHKFSYVIFDACLMGGIEIAYQMKDSTDYVMFSPTEVLTSGYSYSQMVEYLFKTPADLTGMAKNVYDYYNSMTGLYRSVTISLVKCSELEGVADAAKIVFDKYKKNISTLDMTMIQPYFRSNKHWFYDINDFITQLSGNEGASYAAAFKSALEKAVIYKASTSKFIDLTIDPSKYSGISTYIPNPSNEKLNEFYTTYSWEAAVGMTAE